MTYSTLTVVTSARWLADDLGAAGTLPVHHTFGLDAPDLDGRTALWCSGAWATRLRKGGTEHPFLSPGPDWLPTVPAGFLRREVWSGVIGDGMPYKGAAGTFYKLSEHKHGEIPAGIYPGRNGFTSTVLNAFWKDQPTPPDAAFQLHYTGSEPIHYEREFRCFIAHGQVAASSLYLVRAPGVNSTEVEMTWNAWNPAKAPGSSEAAAFAQQVVDAMGQNQPPGYVLDVGQDHDGNWSVIEANAAWSSNIYHADPAAGAVQSILASQEPGNDRWTWKPDQLFLDRSRPLPNDTRLGRTL